MYRLLLEALQGKQGGIFYRHANTRNYLSLRKKEIKTPLSFRHRAGYQQNKLFKKFYQHFQRSFRSLKDMHFASNTHTHTHTHTHIHTRTLMQ